MRLHEVLVTAQGGGSLLIEEDVVLNSPGPAGTEAFLVGVEPDQFVVLSTAVLGSHIVAVGPLGAAAAAAAADEMDADLNRDRLHPGDVVAVEVIPLLPRWS